MLEDLAFYGKNGQSVFGLMFVMHMMEFEPEQIDRLTDCLIGLVALRPKRDKRGPIIIKPKKTACHEQHKRRQPRIFTTR